MLYEEQVYRIYMSDAIRNLSENVANAMMVSGATYIAKRYAEIIYPSNKADVTAEDVIDRIKQKLRAYT